MFEKPMFLILMGVSGSGKTTVGKALAERLSLPFYEGDDFHPERNIQKMSDGKPLNDGDRKEWLDALEALIRSRLSEGKGGILACSALKRAYRDQLRVDPEQVKFIYLKGDYDLIFTRMQAREDHYMSADMLTSQFDDLEPPKDAFTVEVDKPADQIVKEIEDLFSWMGMSCD